MEKEVAVEERNDLIIPDELVVRDELALVPVKEIEADPAEDPELNARAEEFANVLINFDYKDLKAHQDRKESVENMGATVQKRASSQNEMLREPIKTLSKKSEEGGPVANALIDLKMQVEELDPGKHDLEAGWFSRLIGRLPGIGSPLKRYFTRFEKAQTVIDAIIRSLEDGKDQLSRDNKTLVEDQRKMRELTVKLEQTVKLGQLIDKKLEDKLKNEIPPNDTERRKFVQEELIFPLRQRIMDLQQQLAVNQQGVLAIEIIIRNNRELVRGVNRALNVTMNALEVAVTVALALAHQRIVLEKIEAVNRTTSDLISGTSAQLKTQGAAIHKQASSTMLDMEALKSAFHDIYLAMDDIATFRQEALPRMAKVIIEMDSMTKEAEKVIKKMEKGDQARPSIIIEVN